MSNLPCLASMALILAAAATAALEPEPVDWSILDSLEAGGCWEDSVD